MQAWRFNLPVVAVLWILITAPAQANTWPIEKGTAAHRHITDAIKILTDAGGDPAKPPSPAWLANNIQAYLNQGKIKERSGDRIYGSNTKYGGSVYVHFGKFRAVGGGFDPNTDSGFKNLIILASIIAHEKFHSENHGDLMRVVREGAYESAAYLHEIEFLDQLALRIADSCNAIPNDEADRKLECLKRLLVIYRTKQGLIRVYNESRFAESGQPVPEVTVETVDRAVDSLELILPRWEEHAEDISDTPPADLDDLLAAFDAEHGAAFASFHSDLQCAEAQILARLNDQQHALAAMTAAQENAMADRLALVARALGPAGDTGTHTTLVLVKAAAGLLTDAGVYYGAVADIDGEGHFVALQDLAVKPDAVLEAGAAELRELAAAGDPAATARRLQEEGHLTVRPWL